MQVQTFVPTAAIPTCKIDTRSLCHLLFIELLLWVTTGRSRCPLPRGRPVLLVVTIQAIFSLGTLPFREVSTWDLLSIRSSSPWGCFLPFSWGYHGKSSPIFGVVGLRLILVDDAISILPKPFTIDQVSDGFHKERIRFAWITLLGPIIGVNIILE